MAINNFKPFSVGAGANVTAQADYEALVALLTGFQSGKASSAQINKALRQGTVMGSVLAQFISDSAAVDVLDNGNTSVILANLKAAITALTTGRLLKVRTITASGIYTPTAGTKNIVFEAVGGGGGGGGGAATAAGQNSVACGGWAGDFIRTPLLAALTSYSITIGSAGVGAAAGNNAGTNGGNTTVGSIIVARGGVGAAGGGAVTTGFVGGGFGSFVGTITFPAGSVVLPSSGGQRGTICSPASVSGAVGGSGGASMLGTPGYGTTVGGKGQDADTSGFGAGGAGGMQSPSASAVAGGNGTPGVVIAWEFA